MSFQALADSRGHTDRGFFTSDIYDLDLAFSPDADLDSTFDATCLDTGERLSVNGWLFILEAAEAV